MMNFKNLKRFLRRCVRFGFAIGDITNGRLSGMLLQQWSRRKQHVPRLFQRMLFESLLPLTPHVAGAEPAPICVTFPCGQKDLHLALAALNAARDSVQNPVAEFQIVVPDSLLAKAKQVFREESAIRLINENDLVPVELRVWIRERVPEQRRGWALQQAIKFCSAMTNPTPGTLVVDSDTMLLKSRTWLWNDGRQILAPAHEYHPPYQSSTVEFLGDGKYWTPVSWVTHHQLMQKDVVGEIFPLGGQSLVNWFASADWTQQSAICEYHTYGTWLSTNYADRVLLVGWRNVGTSRLNYQVGDGDIDLARIRKDFPGWASVSLHHYLDH